MDPVASPGLMRLVTTMASQRRPFKRHGCPRRLIWYSPCCSPRMLTPLPLAQGRGSQRRTSCTRAACWTPMESTGCRETNWCLTKTRGPPSRVSPCSIPKRCVHKVIVELSSRFCSHCQPSQVLVFDFGGEVYVWTGKDVSLGDRKVAVKLGKQLYGGSYDYSNCRVNPLDASCTDSDVPQLSEGGGSGWNLTQPPAGGVALSQQVAT